MSTWIYRLARASWHARRRVAALWLAILVGLGAVAATVGGSFDDQFRIPGASSQVALDQLRMTFPQAAMASSTMVVIVPAGHHITDADAEQAAEIAQATEFISAKPEGFDSPIAQGGSNVSGGQKQRLSIARAIAKHPQIYLFDDSFSALDYKTDVALRRALKAKTDNATVIIVAQRISTVLHANQILVLDEGRIVGKGTHAQLMESCPAYQEIARSQLSQKELNLQKEGE